MNWARRGVARDVHIYGYGRRIDRPIGVTIMSDTKSVTIEEAIRTAQRCTVFAKNSVYASAWHNGRKHFHFRDGDTMVFNPALASMTVRERATINGFDQRLGDTMARDAATGPADRQRLLIEKKAALRTLIDHYESGTDQWELPRAASTSSVVVDVLVAQAMVRAG